MRKIFWLAIFLCPIHFYVVAQQPNGVAININWPKFMAKQDLIWNRLPTDWDEGPFMGNGEMGTMIYRERNQNTIHFEVCNSLVHDHRNNKVNGNNRLLIGYFSLKLIGEITGGSMRLDLWNAETSANIITTKGTVQIHSFVHANQMAIIIKCETTGEENGFSWVWHAAQGDSPRQLYHLKNMIGRAAKDYEYNPAPVVDETGDIKTCVQTLAQGWQTATAWKEVKNMQSRVLYINTSHTSDGSTINNAKSIVSESSQMPYAQFIQTHKEWWHRYYPESFVTMDDKKTENFYWIQMYKLASATRADRSLIDNTGPWLTITPWPNAWWNLNVQLTYSPLYTANRLELSKSLSTALFRNVKNLETNVPKQFNNYAAAISTNSAFDLVSPVSSNGETGDLTYALYYVWLEYKYSQNTEMAKEQLFPLLKRSINFYLALTKEDVNGKLHLSESMSPEYGTRTEDSNYDLSLFRWGCKALLEMNDRFGLKDSLAQTWRNVLARLTPYPSDHNGYMIGKGQPYAMSHRHYSHLFMIYPLYLVNVDNPLNKKIIQRSLNYWQSKKNALAGYSFTGAASMSAALGNGNDALKYLYCLFDSKLRPNTMYKEAGPVIETPLSGAQSIQEMLLQSWGDKIRVFPAVPDSWKNITFRNLRAAGAFLITGKITNGVIEFIQIESLKGEPCIIKTSIKHPILMIGKLKRELVQTDSGEYQIALKKNEKAILYPKTRFSNIFKSQIESSDGNLFGLNN